MTVSQSDHFNIVETFIKETGQEKGSVSAGMALQSLFMLYHRETIPNAQPALNDRRVHCLKTLPEYYQPIEEGIKTFEVRKDDRGFGVDDVLRLMEFDPTFNAYTGREMLVLVTYILRGGQLGVQGAYVVMSIKRM